MGVEVGVVNVEVDEVEVVEAEVAEVVEVVDVVEVVEVGWGCAVTPTGRGISCLITFRRV